MRSSKKGSSLRDLIDKIPWESIQIYGTGVRGLKPDSVAVSFCQAKKSNPLINEIRVRIGKKVLDELHWEAGDKILPCYDPDNLMLFLLIKSDSGVGYTLARENNSTACRLHFKWTNEFKLDPMPSKMVDFEVHKKKLIFEVNRSHDE